MRQRCALGVAAGSAFVAVGDPIDLSDLAGQELSEKLLRTATDRLMDTLTAMMAEVRGELPSTPRIDVHTVGKHQKKEL